MWQELLALRIAPGKVLRVSIPDGRVDTLVEAAGPAPDGVVVDSGTVYWTTMGVPVIDPSAGSGEASSDFSRRNGGVHAVNLDGSGQRDVLPDGSITTGKQLTSDCAGLLYWGDREGCRVSRARVDGTGLTDLIVNTPDDGRTQECVGVAVDPVRGHLYWTQKGPAKGGVGRILRAGIEIPDGGSAGRRPDVEELWTGLPEPIDLHIDGDWLYWTDRGRPPAGNTLNRAPLPGPGRAGTPPEILAAWVRGGDRARRGRRGGHRLRLRPGRAHPSRPPARRPRRRWGGAGDRVPAVPPHRTQRSRCSRFLMSRVVCHASYVTRHACVRRPARSRRRR